MRRGFTLVELVVALGVLLTAFLSLYGAIILSSRAVQRAAQKTQAAFYLEEGLEASRHLRDLAWANIDTNISMNTSYCLGFGASDYALTVAAPCPFIDAGNVFRRSAIFHNVCRDVSDAIVGADTGSGCGGNTIDTGMKRVTVTVTWGQNSESVEAYLAHILPN